MKKVMVVLLFALIAVVGLTVVAYGQEKPEKPASASQMRWSGHIVRIDNDNSYGHSQPAGRGQEGLLGQFDGLVKTQQTRD